MELSPRTGKLHENEIVMWSPTFFLGISLSDPGPDIQRIWMDQLVPANQTGLIQLGQSAQSGQLKRECESESGGTKRKAGTLQSSSKQDIRPVSMVDKLMKSRLQTGSQPEKCGQYRFCLSALTALGDTFEPISD